MPNAVHLCVPFGQRLLGENVSQLAAGRPDQCRPESDWTDAVRFPDWSDLLSKSGQQLWHLAWNRLVDPQFVEHRQFPYEREAAEFVDISLRNPDVWRAAETTRL